MQMQQLQWPPMPSGMVQQTCNRVLEHACELLDSVGWPSGPPRCTLMAVVLPVHGDSCACHAGRRSPIAMPDVCRLAVMHEDAQTCEWQPVFLARATTTSSPGSPNSAG